MAFAGGVITFAAFGKLVLGLWRTQNCDELRRSLENMQHGFRALEELVKIDDFKDAQLDRYKQKLKELLKAYYQAQALIDGTKESHNIDR